MENIDWDKILSDFKSYEGTISNFCKENNISKQQFYYKRKKSNMINKTVFHEIDFTKEENLKNNSENVEIRINLGQINIYVPSDNIKLIANVIKELSKSC